jgi:iron complex transport system ATP-binding protein
MKAVQECPIIINNLCWAYGEKQILHDINLVLENNVFYSIIGPNGAGKTTLLKNMAALLMPPERTVHLRNCDIRKMSSKKVAREIAYVPQNTYMEFEFTVWDIVLMGRFPYINMFGTESDEDVNIARKAMTITNTWHLRDKSINRISGGERQRVVIARALAQNTGIMLLDEPVSQLDIQHQVQIMEGLKVLVTENKKTIVAVMHDLNLAARYSDRIILMHNGKIIASGIPEYVLTEQNIMSAYGLQVHIMKDPICGSPYIIPRTSGYGPF